MDCYLTRAEADLIGLRSMPGGVFLRLSQERPDGSRPGMFIELGLTQARRLQAALAEAIDQAEEKMPGAKESA